MSLTESLSRRAFLTAAWEVAILRRSPRGYWSDELAAKALARRCPGVTPRRCWNALGKALTLYDTTVAVVGCHADALRGQIDARVNRFQPDFRAVAAEVQRCCHGFPASMYPAVVSWVYFGFYGTLH